jgi:hypothetical protein
MKKLIAAATILAFSSGIAFAHEATENAPRKPAEEVTKVQAPNKSEKKPVSHSGGTDSNGCHTNHQTGDYHCHNPK